MRRLLISAAVLEHRQSNFQKTVQQFQDHPDVASMTWQVNPPSHAGSSAKFLGVADKLPTGSYTHLITIDDDLAYPEGYLDVLADACDTHPESICTFHGSTLQAKNRLHAGTWDYHTCRKVWHFGQRCMGEQVVFGGTGVMGMRWEVAQRLLAGVETMFPIANMDDIWIALAAARLGIDIQLIGHQAGWIKQGIDSPGIWESRVNESAATKLENQLIRAAYNQGLLDEVIRKTS